MGSANPEHESAAQITGLSCAATQTLSGNLFKKG